MSEPKIRFYFDENMPVEAATQLARHGIYVATARDESRLGDDDLDQLQFAIEEGCVICTYDKDFIDLAKLGVEHLGIAYFRGKIGDVGRVVRALRHLRGYESADSMRNLLVYL